MSQIGKSKLFNSALSKLSEQDFKARAIVSYNKQLDGVTNSIKRGELDKEALRKLGDSYNYLTKIYIETLKEDYNKVEDKSNFNDLTALYILNNFTKLCPSKILLPYYERLSFLRKQLEKEFDIELQLGIMLRASLIINRFSKIQRKDAIEKFVKMLENSKEFDSNILYIIYFGLFDGTINNSLILDKEEIINNHEIAWELLNNTENLPDSIIKELCVDKQFENVKPQIVIFIMNLFFMFRVFPKLPDDDMLDIIQKIFNNNVRNFNSKAEFLDLQKLIEKVERTFSKVNLSDEFTNYFVEIVNGLEVLDRKEESKNYGSF